MSDPNTDLFGVYDDTSTTSEPSPADPFSYLYQEYEQEQGIPEVIEEEPLEAPPAPVAQEPIQPATLAPTSPSEPTLESQPEELSTYPVEEEMQASFPDPTLEGQETTTDFFMSGEEMVPTKPLELSSDQQRNLILNALVREKLAPGVRADLRIAYARLLSNEGYMPEQRRPQNERLTERLKSLAEGTSGAQKGEVAEKRTVETARKSERDISTKKSISEVVGGETSIGFGDVTFSKPFTPTAKQYIDAISNDELRELSSSDRAAILKLIPAYSQKADGYSEEDLYYDTKQATGVVTKVIGGGSNILTSFAGVPVAITAAAMAGDTTLAGEAVDDDVNHGAIVKAVTSFFNFKNKPKEPTEVDQIVYNVVEGQPSSSTSLNRVPEISLRAEKIGDRYRMPRFLSGDVAKILGKFSEEEFEKNAKQIIKDRLGVRGTDAAVNMYYGKIKSSVFFRNDPEDTNPLLDENKKTLLPAPNLRRGVAVGPSVKSMSNAIYQELFPEKTLGETVSEKIEKAYKYREIALEMINPGRTFGAANLSRYGAIPTGYSYTEENILEKTKNEPGREEYFEITGGLNPASITPDKMEELVTQYVSNQEFAALREAAKNGLLGDEWQGTGVSKEKANLRHQVAAYIAMNYKQSNTPEFESVVAEYGSNFLEAIKNSPEEMLISLAVIPGFSGFFNEEQIKRSEEKWKDEPLYAALDAAMFSNLFGRLGKAGIMTGKALKDAFTGIKEGKYGNFRSAFSAEKTKVREEVKDIEYGTPEDKQYSLNNDEIFVPDDPAQTIYISQEKSTIVASEKEAARFQEKANKSKDPAEQKSFQNAADAYKANAETAKMFFDEGLPSVEPGGPRVKFVDEPSGMTPKAVQSDAGKRVSTFNEEGRINDFTRTAKERVKARRELYQTDINAAADDVLYADNFIKEFAKSRNIKDPYSNPRGMAKVLLNEGVSDSRIYEYLIENSNVAVESSIDVISKLTAMGKNRAYELGREAREKTIGEILKDGPVNILSKETKESPAFVRDRLDSLKIAEELSQSGQINPFAYSGLSVTDNEIAAFIQEAKRVKRTPSVNRKIQEQEYLLNSDGTYIGPRAVQTSQGPRIIYGFEGPELKPGTPLVRVLGKQLIGKKPYALMSKGGNPFQKGNFGKSAYFTALGAMEYLKAPFAFVHLPQLYRESVSELMNYYYSNGKQSKIVESALTFLVKPSREVGETGYRDFMRLKTEAGITKNEIVDFLNSMPDEMADVVITKESIARALGEDAQKGYVKTTIPAEDMSDIAVNLHKSMDIEMVSPVTGEKVKASDFLRVEIDATNKILREIDDIGEEIARLSELEFDGRDGTKVRFSKTKKGKKAIADLETEVLLRKKRIESGNVYEDINTVYKDSDEKIASMFPRAIDNKQQIAEMGDLRVVPIKPVSELTNFEKTIAAVASEYTLPAKQRVFEKVAQLIAGDENQKLILQNSTAVKSVVLRRTVQDDGTSTYKVEKRFDPTPDGNAKAIAVKTSLEKNLAEIKGKKPPETKAQKAVEDVTGSESNYILANEDEVSSYLLYGDSTDAALMKRPSISFDPKELVPRLANYLSIYISQDGMANLIKKTLDELKGGKLSPQDQVKSIEYLQRQMLFGISEGAELLKENGGNVKKTWQRILAMNDADQTKLLGRALTPQERFFHTEAFGTSFEPKQLLEMYTSYQFALDKTLTGLDQNINNLKLLNMFRNKGWLLTNAEHQALVSSGSPIANSFVDPGNVKPRLITTKTKEEPIFGKSLPGFMMSKPAANFMAKFAGLNLVQDSLANKLFQGFKFSKILDPVGGAIFRNVISSSFFHAYGAGPVPMNPKYFKAFKEDYKRYLKGEELKDPRVEQIIKEGIGTGSRRVEFSGSTDLANTFEDILLDVLGQAGDTGKLIDSIKGVGSTKEIEKLVDILSLKGFEQRANSFLEAFKISGTSSSARVSTKIKKEAGRSPIAKGAEAVYKAGKEYVYEPVLDFYSIFDEYAKGGYTLQLMDQLKLPRSRAFTLASDTFIDYMDMSGMFNALRYGGAGGVGYGLFGMPFVSYSANGFYLGASMLSQNTTRSWIAAHMMRSQDEALEKTLKLQYTVDQYRDLLQKPTLTLLPYQMVEEAKPGSMRGPLQELEDFTSGIASVDMQSISPVSFFSPSRISEAMPANTEGTIGDVVPAAALSIGGPIADMVRASQKNRTASMRKKAQQAVIDEVKKMEEANLPQEDIDLIKKAFRYNDLVGSGSFTSDLLDDALNIITPTIVTNTKKAISAATGETFGGKFATPTQVATKAFGMAMVPASLRNVLTAKIVDSKKAGQYTAAVNALIEMGGTVDGLRPQTITYLQNNLDSVIKSRIELRKEMENLKDPIAIQALKELDLIELKLLGNYTSGKLSEEEFRRFMSEIQ